MNYAEFCTGVGGFRLGIEMSGIDLKSVYANEIDDSCEKTYKHNFGTPFDSKDLFQVDPYSIPDIDLLCAGFPCQPFSAAGKELGFDDVRGTIFFQLVEIIKRKKPGVVFLENVPNLKRHDKGRTFKVIISKLEEIGYKVSSTVLDSTYFGVPQSRSRVYIVGVLEEKYGKKEIKFTDKITEKTPLRPYLIPGDNSIPVTARWNEYARPADLDSQPKLKKNFNRQRKDYYSAETIRRELRDTIRQDEAEGFDILKDELYDGVITTRDKDYDSSLLRLTAVMEHATEVPISNNLQDRLLDWVGPGEKKGVCHMLVNDGRLSWMEDDDDGC